MSYQDQFSRQAPAYARYRPGYPAALFDWLASIAPGGERAWDCGTGSGQAAIGLAERFAEVIATDASAEQIGHAVPHEHLLYRVAPAEHSGIPDATVDLVTVAQAVHWFDFDRFYAEVERVLRPNGVIAVWSYHLSQSDPSIDALLHRFYFEILGPYWSPRIALVNDLYRTLPFPFEEIDPPQLTVEALWRLDELAGYLGSWSATQRFREMNGRDPIMEIRDELERAWGAPEQPRRLTFPLAIRAGRVRRA